MYDTIIIGGGPAGMTAALYSLRANKKILILEKDSFGGQITYSPLVENYPGTLRMSGDEFADRMLDQITALGAEFELETAVSISPEKDIFTVKTEEGCSYSSRCVIIAAGVEHRMLGVPGEYELVGNGLSFCAVCDGTLYKDKTAAVVGGGNSALQEAILLSELCRGVIVVQNLDYFTGEKRLADKLMNKPNVKAVFGTVVKSFLKNGEELSGLRLVNEATGEESEIAVDGLFVAIGLLPKNSRFSNVAELDGAGYFLSGENCRTRTPGIFCAGDCRVKSVRQLTTAVGDGATAALAACDYLDGFGD